MIKLHDIVKKQFGDYLHWKEHIIHKLDKEWAREIKIGIALDALNYVKVRVGY